MNEIPEWLDKSFKVPTSKLLVSLFYTMFSYLEEDIVTRVYVSAFHVSIFASRTIWRYEVFPHDFAIEQVLMFKKCSVVKNR